MPNAQWPMRHAGPSDDMALLQEVNSSGVAFAVVAAPSFRVAVVVGTDSAADSVVRYWDAQFDRPDGAGGGSE